jgi:putative transposase
MAPSVSWATGEGVFEAALEAELTENLGHEHGGDSDHGQHAQWHRSPKAVLAEIGPVVIEMPRGRVVSL